MTAALPVSRRAHVLVPPAHPFRPVFGQEIPIHVGDHHAPADVAHPVWERVRGQIEPGRQPIPLAGRGKLPLGTADEIDEAPSGREMLRATDDRDPILDRDGSALREDVPYGHAAPATDQHVGQIPNRQQPLLACDSLAHERGVLLVRLRLAIESPQPGETGGGVARLVETALNDEPENGTHRPARERVADDDLPGPLGIEQVVPVLRRVFGRTTFSGYRKTTGVSYAAK